MTLSILTTAFVLMAATPPAKADLPRSLDLTTIRGMVVQYDGRWPPLDTVAREVVEDVTGSPEYLGHDPVLMLLGWTFNPRGWMRVPLIKIGNAELRKELELPKNKRVYSFLDLAGHRPLQSLIEQLSRVQGTRKLDALEKKVSDIHNQLQTLQEAFLNQTIKPIPDANDALGPWRPIALLKPGAKKNATSVQSAWASLRRAFLANDRDAFSSSAKQLVSALADLPAAHRPPDNLIATELRYNRLNLFHTAWIVMAIGSLLSAGALWVRKRSFDLLALLGLLAGFVMLTYGLALRWQIAGRIPASNMYESLLLLSWGTCAFAILSMFLFRQRIVPLTASALGALALCLADVLPINSYIRPIAPVLLDTVWMGIHVPIIMVSYSVLALGVLIAHVQLVTMAAAPKPLQLAATLDSLHYWYIHVGSILLLAGVVTGSMWAACSWGRYWGWDPKEVWSLVALLGYLAILHMRIDHHKAPRWAHALGALMIVALLVLMGSLLRPMTGIKYLALLGSAVAIAVFLLANGPFATAVKSILAFWLIIMTYVGVNFVLGIGLHSYGFGTGAVATRMFTVGAVDLLLVAICSVVYIIRHRTLRHTGISLSVMSARS